MEEFTIPRKGKLPLKFTGEVLSYASSYVDGKPRWFEVEIYRTESGKYVVHGSGLSDVSGETDWHWAEVCETPGEVITALERDGDQGRYLPTTSMEALEEAADVDPNLRAVFGVEI